MFNVRPKQLSLSGELKNFSYWLKGNCKHYLLQTKRRQRLEDKLYLFIYLLNFEQQFLICSGRHTNPCGRSSWCHLVHSTESLSCLRILMVQTYIAVFEHFQISTQGLNLFYRLVRKLLRRIQWFQGNRQVLAKRDVPIINNSLPL